jgi:hypothetical protein
VPLLRVRLARVRRDYTTRHTGRAFPATGGPLLAAMCAAVEEAESALAALAGTEEEEQAPAQTQSDAGASSDGDGAADRSGPGLGSGLRDALQGVVLCA